MTLAEYIVAVGIWVFLITAIIGCALFLSFRPPNDRPSCSGGKVRELRRLARFGNSDEAILSWQEADTPTQTLRCCLTDISEYGAGVRVQRALPLGTQLSVRIPARRLGGAANVRRCSAARWKYDLGLEFRGPLHRI